MNGSKQTYTAAGQNRAEWMPMHISGAVAVALKNRNHYASQQVIYWNNFKFLS